VSSPNFTKFKEKLVGGKAGIQKGHVQVGGSFRANGEGDGDPETNATRYGLFALFGQKSFAIVAEADAGKDKFDDPGDMGHLIPPSFAVVSISTAYPSWDAIAKGADSTPVSGLGDDAYLTGSGIVLFVRKGTVVISTTVADMIVEDLDQGDFNVDPAQDRAKAESLARLVLGKLP